MKKIIALTLFVDIGWFSSSYTNWKRKLALCGCIDMTGCLGLFGCLLAAHNDQ